MIGFIFSGLTLTTLAVLLFPLLRSHIAFAPARADYEMDVYRDQLAGLTEEVERGLITADQAASARLEIQRRILDSANIQTTTIAPDNRRANWIAAFIVTLGVLIGSWQLYTYLGAPHLPDRPFAARQNDPDMQMNATVEVIAAELEVNPDAENYRQLGEMFFFLRRFNRAAEATQKAIDLGANDAEAWSQLGASLVMMNDGAVVMDAQNAFKTALAKDKNEPRARFYMALAEAQIGETRKAVGVWRDLEKTLPPDAPWLPMIKGNIDFYARQDNFDPASIPPVPAR